MNYPDIELRADRLYSEEIAAEVLSVPTNTLARWREQSVGPNWMVLPEGNLVRYYGKGLLEYTTPEGLGVDPRDIFQEMAG